MPTVEKQDIINKSNLSTKYGIYAGLSMALFLFIMQLFGNDFSPFAKLGKYILLGLIIVIALNKYKEEIKGDVFIKGIGLGTKLSLIAGLILVILNYALFFIYPEVAFSKYSIEPENLGQVTMISGVLMFETLVFGSLITFMVLQFIKGKIRK